MPAYFEQGLRVEFWGDDIEALSEFDPLTGEVLRPLEQFDLYPANQYVTTRGKLEGAIAGIKAELEERVAWFEKNGRYLEAQRIRMRTQLRPGDAAGDGLLQRDRELLAAPGGPEGRASARSA